MGLLVGGVGDCVVGLRVGCDVGDRGVGLLVRRVVGDCVGNLVGSLVRSCVPFPEGDTDGRGDVSNGDRVVGLLVGCDVGDRVVGLLVGRDVSVRVVGLLVRRVVGNCIGNLVGSLVRSPVEGVSLGT